MTNQPDRPMQPLGSLFPRPAPPIEMDNSRAKAAARAIEQLWEWSKDSSSTHRDTEIMAVQANLVQAEATLALAEEVRALRESLREGSG